MLKIAGPCNCLRLNPPRTSSHFHVAVSLSVTLSKAVDQPTFFTLRYTNSFQGHQKTKLYIELKLVSANIFSFLLEC